MSEQPENVDVEPEKKGKPIILILAVSVFAIAAGIGTPFLIKQISSSEKSSSGTSADETEEYEFVEFGEVVVNIDEPRLTRYLRLDISLQVAKSDKGEIEEAVTKHQKILKDWLNGYLADQQMESIRGQAGQNRMRREIKDHFNSVMFPDGFDRIQGVLFMEFNVQ